jgi:hypothetical protein
MKDGGNRRSAVARRAQRRNTQRWKRTAADVPPRARCTLAGSSGRDERSYWMPFFVSSALIRASLCWIQAMSSLTAACIAPTRSCAADCSSARSADVPVRSSASVMSSAARKSRRSRNRVPGAGSSDSYWRVMRLARRSR